MKSKLKKEKQERKQYLRQIDRKKKLAESSDGSNQDQYIKKTFKRGNKWWNKINLYYFKNFTDDFIFNMKQFTTSEDLLEFGSQVSSLMNYYQTILCKLDHTQQSIVFHDNSIRIIFGLYNKLSQTQKHILVSYLYRQPLKQYLLFQQYSQPMRHIQFYSFHEQQLKNCNKNLKQKQIQNLASQVDISLSVVEEDEDYILKCLEYQTLWRNQKSNQIQKQIECWKYQLNIQHQENQKIWNQIQLRIEKQKQVYAPYDQQQLEKRIQQYKKMLVCNQTISYFRLGYSDKTPQQLQKSTSFIKQYDQQNQHDLNHSQNSQNHNIKQYQFFETDCKICFCTKNQQSNKVIYCDSCSTSFHQTCYGIQNIYQDKQVICDICTYIKKQKIPKKQSPSCQICGRTKFPIKNIDNHFYHVSCLILFDFAQINEFEIKLKQDITHQKIIQSVIDNQILHQYCQYCFKYSMLGMQFICSFPSCNKSFHPICAYLYGCIFNIKRKKNGGIDVKVQCRQHTIQNIKQQITQIYLRRFLCNYRNTAEMKQQQFKKKYEKQLEKSNKDNKCIEFNQIGIKRIMKIKINIENDSPSTFDKKLSNINPKYLSSLLTTSNTKSSNKQQIKHKKNMKQKQ